MEFRRDQFRVDPTIVIDTAFEIAEAYGQQYARIGGNASSTTLPDRQAIGYDVFLDGDSIDHFEFQDEVKPRSPKLRKQHERYEARSSWDEGDIELYGEPPFPDQRFFIEYGGGPYITLTVHFDQYITRHGGYCYERQSRTFVPSSYPNDELAHYRILREQLKEWLYEFLPRDPNRIRSREDIDSTTGGEGHEHLKQRVVRYLNQLPDVEVNRPTGLVELEDLENWDTTVSQRCVFEPSYVAGLLDITRWYAADLCRELCNEDDWPVVSLDPPGDAASFEYHDFVVGHEDHWGSTEEYDYSTYKYEGADRVTSERIWIS